MVTPGRAAGRAPRRLHRAWSVPLAVLGMLPMLAIVVTSFVPSTAFIDKHHCVEGHQNADGTSTCTKRGAAEAVQFAVVPADAQPAGPRLTIDGLQRYDATGNILFVTVREPELQLFEYYVAHEPWPWSKRPNPAVSSFDSYADVYPVLTPQQDREEGYRQMRDAKQEAQFAALSALGFPVKDGAVVVSELSCLASDGNGNCTKRSSAADLLKPNDAFVSVDGKRVCVVGDLDPILSTHHAGDTVTIVFKRNGTQMSGDVQLVSVPQDGGKPDRTIIGFVPGDTRTIDIPTSYKLDFNTTGIGGPSAGLSFTLTLIDELSAGNLTGGKKIAVTGTIDASGHVGAIGGLRSKASAVRQAGAKYFIVPAEQGDADIAAARRSAGAGVTIIPVKTLQEALDALQRLGGDALVKQTSVPTPPADHSAACS